MLRFLSGLLVVQLITGIMVFLVVRQTSGIEWTIVVPPLAVIALLTALWFSSQSKQHRDAAVGTLTEEFSREREKIQINAERSKRREIKKNHQELSKQIRRVQSGANAKIGLAFAGLIGLGGLLLFTQLLNLGILLLSTAGGGLAGYLLRGRNKTVERGDIVHLNKDTKRKLLPWKKNK